LKRKNFLKHKFRKERRLMDKLDKDKLKNIYKKFKALFKNPKRENEKKNLDIEKDRLLHELEKE
jgi:hypothetical protein